MLIFRGVSKMQNSFPGQSLVENYPLERQKHLFLVFAPMGPMEIRGSCNMTPTQTSCTMFFFRKSLKIAIDLALIFPKWGTSSTERPEKKHLQRIPHLLPGFLLKKSRASMRFSNSSSFKPCNPPKPQDSARPKREEWGTTSDRDP